MLSSSLPRSASPARPAIKALPRPPAMATMAVRTLWFLVVPLALALLSIRAFVPLLTTTDDATLRKAIELAQENRMLLGAGLFLLFSGAAHYWRVFLPGAQFLSPIPVAWARELSPGERRGVAAAIALVGSLSKGRMRRRVVRALAPERLAELDGRLADLRAGVIARSEGLVRDSAIAARTLAAPALSAHRRIETVWAVIGMAAALGIAFGVRSRLFESYQVLSGSMLPSLQPEDRIVGNRIAYRTGNEAAPVRLPHRGDIVVFASGAVDGGELPNAPDFLVKRVIGLPGDRISMHGSVPVINGWSVPVCDAAEYLYLWHGGENGLDGRLVVEFLENRAYLTVHAVGTASFAGTYEVKPGEVFVLGDNRNNSLDSRAWNAHRGGGVPLEAIEARVQWFVAGRRADLGWDFSRAFRPIDSLATTLHLDGIDTRPLEQAITRCLEKRPEKTQPPDPNALTLEAAGAPKGL